MTKKRITSKPGSLGYTYHFDERGKYIGKSRPGLMGGRTIHYDADGRQVGISRPGFLAKEVYHDQKNSRHLSSFESPVGDVHLEDGTPIGITHPGLFGTAYTLLEQADAPGENQEYSEGEYTDTNTPSPPEQQDSGLQNLGAFILFCIIIFILTWIFKK